MILLIDIKNNKVLTNFKLDLLDKYQTAVNMFNELGKDVKLSIVRNAYDNDNKLLPQCMSLHTSKPERDHSDFWDIYKAL